MKSLIRHITLGNIILAGAAIVFLLYINSPLVPAQTSPAAPSASAEDGETAGEEQEIPAPSPADFLAVSEENLFHPERKIPAEKKAEQPLPKPDFVLYGTMITDGLSLAYMEDLKAPRSSPGRGKRQVAMRKGDRISGFTLKEIFPEKVLLVRGEEQLTVAINDPTRLKERSAPGTQQTPSPAPSPAPAPKTQTLQKANPRPPQAAIQSSPSPDGFPHERPGRRRGSQKTFAPQVPKQ